MDESFIRNRITQLRTKKGVSEYKMSTDMGHSKGYIQCITSGRALPSLTEFLYICEYLDVTPKYFFDENEHQPALVSKALNGIEKMQEKDLKVLLLLIERLNNTSEQ